MPGEANDVGRTAQSGYQLGVRKTVPFSEQQLWMLLLSADGMRTWLGGTADLAQTVHYRLDNGTTGDVRVLKPGSHLRLTWQPQGWTTPSVLQIRIISAKTGTTLSFHQEQLSGTPERTEMKVHWEQVIRNLTGILETSSC